MGVCRECVWRLGAGRGQRLLLQVTGLLSVLLYTCSVVQVADLSLRSTADCRDRLQVREEGLTLLTLCGDLEGRATVISTNNQVSHLES